MLLSVDAWDINLMDFINKFYSHRDKMKIKFYGFEEEVNDFVVKTLIIERLGNVPHIIRDKMVDNIDVEDNLIVVKIKATLPDMVIKEMKSNNCVFET